MVAQAPAAQRSASDRAMEAHLVACIHDNISQYLYENARWLGERLVAAAPSEV